MIMTYAPTEINLAWNVVSIGVHSFDISQKTKMQ